MNPPVYTVKDGVLSVAVSEKTDFWQRTRYGFSRDTGHALLTSVSTDFSIKVKTNFSYRSQYDQCGLYIRVDSQNWIKVAIEKEHNGFNRLGSVVTNLGFSDWATSNIDASVTSMWYRASSLKNDFFIESSPDGINWQQMRITHMHSRQHPVNIGIYACSPEGEGFNAEFSALEIETG